MLWLATILNFFLPGAGYLVAKVKPPWAVLWLLGAVGLTIVEFGIQESEPDLYLLMFASVFAMNLAFAIDVYRTVKDREMAVSS